MRERFATIDYHTAGEPFRIVPDLGIPIDGDDVASRRVFAAASPEVDRARRLLCFEPRGHADMYGGFIVEPDDAGAHLGVLFWHKDGFSTACGHGTIALGVWAIESGLVAAHESGTTDVIIDVPSGRVTARVRTAADGTVTGADFINVPGYVLARRVPVQTSRGDVLADITFAGAIYAQVDATAVGLSIEPEDVSAVIAFGREVKWLLNDSAHAEHPSDRRLSGIYGTILYSDHSADGVVHQRNATIFADGELDRSPCGSGTCARVATLTEEGTLPVGAELVHDSIVGSRFLARVVAEGVEAGHRATTTQVSGIAHKTGEHVFEVDPSDEMTPGFVLR
ncbi:proline racemase family protein [Pseudoclavibacter sp. RFBA6]|uniref:proline racemase family protein n=1 Tax=Pseudoclavibacter sp. RFBA6 TaxID=2080573 RepID=UPI000CE8C02B|nr:proline racemase family protein [Pseudoclavibacter sp. RFBA6]PPG38718.1 proline racemase [Pseudoclavibacter sp. RFBA6]